MNITLNATLHEQVTPEYLAAFDTAMTALEHASAFLIHLTPTERVRLRTLGPSNVAFVPDVIDAATLHADLVPAHRGATAIAKRRDAAAELNRRLVRLDEFRQRFSDTARVCGDGCVALCLETYQFLKKLAPSENIEATVDRLARRFEANAAASRKPRPGTGTPATGGTASPAPSSGGAPSLVSLPAPATTPLTQAA